MAEEVKKEETPKDPVKPTIIPGHTPPLPPPVNQPLIPSVNPHRQAPPGPLYN